MRKQRKSNGPQPNERYGICVEDWLALKAMAGLDGRPGGDQRLSRIIDKIEEASATWVIREGLKAADRQGLTALATGLSYLAQARSHARVAKEMALMSPTWEPGEGFHFGADQDGFRVYAAALAGDVRKLLSVERGRRPVGSRSNAIAVDSVVQAWAAGSPLAPSTKKLGQGSVVTFLELLLKTVPADPRGRNGRPLRGQVGPSSKDFRAMCLKGVIAGVRRYQGRALKPPKGPPQPKTED
jgi:hypothetical protein